MNKPSIIIIGDSHVNIYRISNLGSITNVWRIIHVDSEDTQRTGKYIPYLMNTIANKGEDLLGRYIELYKDVDYMMFVFGEPDVRIHLDKQINVLARNEDEVIESLCQRYISKLLDIVPHKRQIIVRYILPQREYSMFGSIYTPNGDIADRVRYTSKINHTLSLLCQIHGILFFDNYQKAQLVNATGSLKDEYCDGTTHYNENAIPLINRETDELMSIVQSRYTPFLI
jgi:hypothetical protein